MSEDLQGNLKTYKLQMQQVEAALTTDPLNEELQKLKTDLLEVIALTRDLLRVQSGEGAGEPSGENEPEPAVPEAAEEVVSTEPKSRTKRSWKVGDRCLAFWPQDGHYYEATVEEITEDGDVSVKFDVYGSSGVTTLARLRELPPKDPINKRKGEEASLIDQLQNKKHAIQKQREYLKKRKAKKQQRFKQIEEERESEKNKWLAFSQKSHGKKGMIKKSIFASPDNINGRVGIGTCGIGGRPMTEYTQAEKWRKGV